MSSAGVGIMISPGNSSSCVAFELTAAIVREPLSLLG